MLALVAYLLNLAIFLLPGFALTLWIAARRELLPIEALISVIASSAAIGYLAFWIYFADKSAGKIFSFGVISASAAGSAIYLRRGSAKQLAQSIAVPIGYVAIAGLCYLCWLFLFSEPLHSGADFANFRFFEDVRAGDNVIPYIFAERIYSHEPLKPFCCGDWLSSDRPPLQAGIYLVAHPLRIAGPGLSDQVLGTGLQCLWICGVWTLLVSLRAPPHRIQQVLGFLFFSGFLFYNSVYVWPKLLAATFILFLASLLFAHRENDAPFTFFGTVLAAVTLALAILAHPGSALSLPGLLLIAPKARSLRLRHGALAIAILLLFLLPWTAYQRFYDPPGNRLLKMHLAGAIPIDSRSTVQALTDAYTKPSAGELVRNKWANVEELVGPKPLDVGPPLHFDADTRELTRAAQRDYIWNAIGILNVGWPAALILLIRRKQPALSDGWLLLGISMVNLFVWCLALYGPGGTITASGSYANILLLSLGLLGFVLVLPRFLVVLLFGLQIANVALVWIWSLPNQPGAPTRVQWPFLIAGCIATIALAWHFGASYWTNGLARSRRVAITPADSL